MPAPLKIIGAIGLACTVARLVRIACIEPARPRWGAIAVVVLGMNASPGAPTLWNLLSVSVGPVWHSLQAALPMKSPSPSLALALS